MMTISINNPRGYELDEPRICDVCGCEMNEGFMDDSGDMHVCEKCFDEYMDETYGKHRWMALGNDEQDEYGGYYIHTADVAGGYEGTGIFWTQWTY